MAVLEDVPGIEVKVCVDGKPLQEYPTENDELQDEDQDIVDHREAVTVTQYIQSTTDKVFVIKLKVCSPFKIDCPNLSFEIYVDGQEIDFPLVHRDQLKNGRTWRHKVEGPFSKVRGQTVVRPMKFAAINTTSESLHEGVVGEHKKALDGVGEITVLIYRESAGRRETDTQALVQEMPDYEKTYHQKACVKDNKSHGSKLGKAEFRAEAEILDVEMLDGAGFPIAIMKFKYRSEEALRELLVIQRTPEPDLAPEPELEPTPAPSPGAPPAPASAPNPSVPLTLNAAGVAPVIVSAPTAAPAQGIEALQALVETQKRQLDQLLSAAIAGSTAAGAAPAIKAENGPAPRIKREHPDGHRSGGPSKRAKQIGKVTVTIDLTSDGEEDIPVINLDD